MESELDQYDYELPRDLIAQNPLPRRTDARLMLVDRKRQTIEHYHVRDLPSLLKQSDRLVLNDTRVIPAQLVGHRTETKGRWFGLFLGLEETGAWRLLCKSRGKLRPGESITLEDRTARNSGQLILVSKDAEGVWVAMPVGSDEDSEDPFALLDRVGRVPLPPYIRGGKMVDSDVENYQTVFAKHRGAVAAPTAGLHFTADLLKQLSGGGINLSAVTLHVGRDTFKPIATNRLSEHSMHSEWASVSEKTAKEIEETKVSGGRIIAVGTTVVRTLETAAKSGKVQSFTGQTDLFIKPPYEFRAVDALITNFHLPRTTLLVLARTFGGDELIEQAYVEAVAEHYRFYSYGDTMLIV